MPKDYKCQQDVNSQIHDKEFSNAECLQHRLGIVANRRKENPSKGAEMLPLEGD